MKSKKSFVLYNDYLQWLKLLSDEETGKLIRAIFTYENDRTLPDFSDKRTEIAFYMIKENLDRDRKKYEKVCEKNKENAQARWKKMKQNGIEIPAEEMARYAD